MSPFLVIFDVDGTLVDSQAHILAAMELAHEAGGVALPARAAVLEIVGLSLPEAFRQLHPEVPETAREALVAGYKEAFGELRRRGHEQMSPLFPDVAEGLARLGDDPALLLGAATGKSRRGLSAVIEMHGLEGRFVTTQTADDHPSKPHPAMLLAALAETGLTPERAVMVGDTTYDIEMGRAAGMRTIGVDWGYHAPARLVAAGADRVVGRFAEIEALVREMAA